MVPTTFTDVVLNAFDMDLPTRIVKEPRKCGSKTGQTHLNPTIDCNASNSDEFNSNCEIYGVQCP